MVRGRPGTTSARVQLPHAVCRLIDREALYLRYIIAYNWAAMVQMALYLCLLLVTIAARLPDGVADFLVEHGPAHDVFARPLHPYTRSLLASVLRPDLDAPERLAQASTFVVGDVPSFHEVPAGCRFHPRCPFATDRCREEPPQLQAATGDHARDHEVACHHWEEIMPMPLTVRAK